MERFFHGSESMELGELDVSPAVSKPDCVDGVLGLSSRLANGVPSRVSFDLSTNDDSRC